MGISLKRREKGGNNNDQSDWKNEKARKLGRNEVKACTYQMLNVLNCILNIKVFIIHTQREWLCKFQITGSSKRDLFNISEMLSFPACSIS